MSLKADERMNLETMEIEKIPVVEAKKEEKPVEEKVEDSAKEEEEEIVDEKAESKKEEEKPEEEEGTGYDINAIISDEYADKYDIKSKEDLDSTLDLIDDLGKKISTYESEIATLKKKTGEPQFKSEEQKKLWEFMQDVDPSKMGDRLQTYARLTSIDTEKDDPKLLLQEQYIMQHPAWTREEAQMKFERTYNRNYSANRDDFDSEEEYKSELKSKELDMKDDVLKAKDFLKKQKEQFKTEPKAEEKQSEENTIVTKSIEQITSQVDKYDFTELVFSPTEDKEDDFSVQLSKEQIKSVKDALRGWVSNPVAYNQKGELIGGWDVEQKSVQIAFMLHGPEIVQKNYEHAIQLASIKRAEEISTKKPDRKTKVAGDNPGGNLSEEKQWEMMIAKKKAERAKPSAVYH